MTLGIAFAGGGVRSASQLGIMQFLYEQNIIPTVFTGTSGGAIVATLLSLGYSPKDALETFINIGNIKDIAYWHIISRMITGRPVEGLLKGNKLQDALAKAFDNKCLVGVSIDSFFKTRNEKLAVITTDINTGRQVIFTNDISLNTDKINDDDYVVVNNLGLHLSSIVKFSCSLPALFITRKFNNMRLVDGGITNNLPSDIALALGADKVISIDLGFSGRQGQVSGIHKILSQSLDILMEREIDNNRKDFGLYLNPRVFDVGMLDTNRINECYNRGYEYAKNNASLIDEYLKG